jgi:hypothetical protein
MVRPNVLPGSDSNVSAPSVPIAGGVNASIAQSAGTLYT